MQITMKQVSAMEKIRAFDPIPQKELTQRKALKGQRISYQICLQSEPNYFAKIEVISPLKDYVEVFVEKEVYMDVPVNSPEAPKYADEFITLEPGFMPEVLVPVAEQNNIVRVRPKTTVLWINVNVPENIDAGKFDICIQASLSTTLSSDVPDSGVISTKMELEVLDVVLPEQKIIYTRWFHTDCIATQHNVEIYSEQHWILIEEYIKRATSVGINMILVPAHTPPLDTAIGTTRPCVQLVDIEKKGDTYTFDFTKFKRFVDICKRNGVKYYEMAHLFSQWGAKCAPNIKVTENGKTDYMFGWHVAATDPKYIEFLKQYIQAISDELKKEGIDKYTYFHVSDEPTTPNMAGYETAVNILKPIIGDSKIFDALVHVEFYEKGLVTCPVTSVGSIHDFLPYNIEDQWVYYCDGPIFGYTNSYLTNPSAKIRILGAQIYKYDIKGFLHWGLNFYYCGGSIHLLNPYLTTSSDGIFSSGSAYILYPSSTGAYNSISGEITFQAMQDTRLLDALAQKYGREKAVELIDKFAERDLRFDDFPIDNNFYEALENEIYTLLSE